jgi:hypothetical protein
LRFDQLSVPLTAIGHEFTKLYWSQTVVYHLRQAASLSKESEAVRRVRDTAAKYQTRALSDLPEAGRTALDRQMSRLLTINVLEAFHVSKPPGMMPLYERQRGSPNILLSVESHRFLREHGAALELVANFYWVEFLESCNRLTPRIVQKVARDGAARKSLKRYLDILLAESPAQCFYCGAHFDGVIRPAVDHVIPWSFLLEDDLWDLVLACAQCNARKSDWLPRRDYLEKLIVRNQNLCATHLLSVGAEEIGRFYDAAISVEWPEFWAA